MKCDISSSICPRATLKNFRRRDPCTSSLCNPCIQLLNSLPKAQGNKMWDGATENHHRNKRRARALLKAYLGLISCRSHAPQWSNYETALQCGDMSDMWRRRVLERWQDSLWHAKSRGISCFRTAVRENQNTTAARPEAPISLFENYLVLCLGKNGKLQHIGLYLSTCVRNTVVALALVYLALSTLQPNYPVPPPHNHKETRCGTARNHRRKRAARPKPYQRLICGLFLAHSCHNDPI